MEAKKNQQQQNLREKYGEHKDGKEVHHPNLNKIPLTRVISNCTNRMDGVLSTWLKHIRSDFKERHLKCAHQKNQLHQRRAKWKQQKRWLIGSIEAKQAVGPFRDLPTKTPVKLNIGGCRYSSNLATLRRYRGSYLEILFSTRYRVPPLRMGEYFLDRDPTNFNTILNLLIDPDGAQTIANINHNQPLNNLENDIHYFLKPRTKCEHIDILPIDIETDRFDQVTIEEDFESVMDSSNNNNSDQHFVLGDFKYDNEHLITDISHSILGLANTMIHQVYTRYVMQSKYLEKLELHIKKEDERVKKLELFLKDAQYSLDVEYNLVEYYLKCIRSMVELQFGENKRFRVLTSIPTLTNVKSSRLFEMFDKGSPNKLKPVSEKYYRAPRYIIYESEPDIFLSLLNYLRAWYPEPPSIADTTAESRVKIWSKSREYRVYTRNWLKLLPSLNSKEQWQLHWKDVIDEDDDSMFAE